MIRGIAKIGPLGIVVAAGLWLTLGGVAHAQEPPGHPDVRAGCERRSPEHGRRGRGHGKAGSRWGRHIFEPSKEDRGPLQPGEEEELREFVAQQLPRFARLLRRVENQDPSAFRRAFRRLVPRLRHLRRIHAENPELAELIEQHAANLYAIERLRRTWQRTTDDKRELIERRMRAYLAKNAQIEIAALTRWADELEAGREQRVENRLAELTAEHADLAAEPQGIRQRVAELAAESDDARRSKLEEQLRTILGRQLDHKVAALRRRVAQLHDNAPREIDRRMERLRKGPRHRRHEP